METEQKHRPMENRLSDYNCFSLRTAIYICFPLRTANVVSLYSKRADNINARTGYWNNPYNNPKCLEYWADSYMELTR